MKVSKTGYKKNSKDKNEPALVIPSNKITMKGVEFPVYGVDDTGYSQMMFPGMDYTFPGNYVHELPMAKNGMSAPGPSKVIGGKLEISYDKDRNIYLRSLDSADWTKVEGDKAKEFRTKFAEHLPGYFDPSGSIKQISKKAAKQVGTKQQIVDDKPKYQEVPQQAEPTQEIQQAPQSPLQQVAAGVPPMLAKSTAQPGFGDQILSGMGNPEKIKQTKLQSKYQTSPDYHVTPYSTVNQANKAYEKTIDYKLRYKNLNEYSTEDIPKIQEKLYNEGYLQKPEQIDLANFKTKEQVTELQKKLAKFGLIDMLGKDGVNGVLNKQTKDAAKRFNELNQTYKPGELDDMTKQAIKNFKSSTDAKNAMGLPIVNPKELYDPETGEAYIDQTYEAMTVFENSLKSKGYFLGDEGYDISESAASNPKVSFNFKLNPDPTTPFGMCAAYVNGTVCKDDVVGEEARDELGFKGSAWHMSENIQEKGGQLLYTGLPDRSSVNLNGKNEITGYLKSQLTSPEAQNQLRSIIGDGNMWGANTKVKPGDVVNIFYEGSNYTEEAYNQTKPLNNRFFTTHVGIVKAGDDGTLYVEHNVHGNVEKDKLQDFADGKVKGNGKNRVSLISGITRPNYIDGVDNEARIPAGGISYYQTQEGQFNPKGALANSADPLGQIISGEKTYKYLTTIEKNKDKLLKDIPISDTEFGKLMRVARVIPTLETYGGQNAGEEKTIGYAIEKGLKDIVSEKSTGFTKLKDASNLGEDIRQNLYQNDDSQLTDPVKAALPTFYLLSKNYLYLKEVANRNNIDVTSDELAKLAGLSYNQSIGKIAGELVDKGSYQNYYNYRVKTATDPGGNFKYRKVMDLYDRQTMRDGGITAPGRFKNPEGNWVSKYANGGDISIPDLSKKGWLDKYQDGRQFNKYDIMSGVYDDMKQATVPSSTYVDMPAPTKQDVQRVQTEAKRVNQKMKDTGVKSPAEVYAKEAVESKLMQQPTLNPAEEKAVGDYISHGWDVATHPTTALGYKVRGQEIPWGFSKADYNPFEVATAVINPATYINAAGRLASAAVSPSTYTNMLPKTLGALAGTMMNENVPEEWTNEAIKSGMLALDASTLPILRSLGRTAPAKEAAKYLTTQTPLKNAYKLNPQAKGSLFKPWDENMGYRVVNQEGYDDALKSFLVRSNPKGDNTVFSRPTSFPSFAKGKPSKNFLNTDATPHYIMETDIPLYARGDVNPVTGIPIRSSHGAARPIDPITGEALTSLPIEDINSIYKAQPNWLKGYERVYNSPKNFNFKNFKQGKNIAESGAFNQGVYELPDYPGYLLKYERPEQVADYIPEFKGMNMAEMQKGLTSPNIGKVIKQHTISNPNQKDLNAYIMRRMEGQPLTSLDIDQVTNIPREAWIQYAKDYNEIARNNLAIDNMGSNVFYDRASKSFKFIDLSPGVTPKMDQYWANTVIGDIGPRLSEEKLKEAIRNGILGQIEKNTQYNVEKANKVLRDKADDMNLTLDDMLNLSNDFDLQGSLTKSAVKRSLMREGFKKGGVKSSAEGYYDYINGYSGIFANGGRKGWLDNYK